MSDFVAVLLRPPGQVAPYDVDGATAVLEWADLAASGAREPTDDDRPAVLIGPAQDLADLRRVLELLAAEGDGPVGSLRGAGDTVVATTRPVTDTLKLVAVDGRLTGTADRERHRFVDLPIAAPLGLLRAAAGRLLELEGPLTRVTAVDVLSALAGAGAVVLSCPAAAAPHRPNLTR